MTEEDKALVDRLRWVSEWYFVDPVDGAAYASDDPLDAADRIEALITENERLRGECAAIVAWLRQERHDDEWGDWFAEKIEAGEHLK